MKKQIFVLALLSMLASFPLFAQSPLTEKFSNLSKEIISSSVRPFDRLEQLKTIFTDCSLKNKNPEIKSACAEWLSGTYQEIKEATPEQIYVELGSGDVEVKKIGEITLPIKVMVGGEQQQTFMQYEVNIPKYHFTYQFMLNLGEEEALKSWQRSQSGSIVIPYSSIKTLEPKTMFRLYTTPTLSSKSTLEAVGKLYKQVFKEVYALNNLKAFYGELLEDRGEMDNFTQEYLFFLRDNETLPFLTINTNDGGSIFSGNLDNLYGFIRGNGYYCMVANLMGIGKQFVGPCDEKEKTHNPYWGDFWADDGVLFWNRNTPQYIWVYGDKQLETLPNLGRGRLIIK